MLDPLIGWGLIGIGACLFVAELLTPGQTFLMVPGTFFGTLGIIGLATMDQSFTFGTGLLIGFFFMVLAAVINYTVYKFHEMPMMTSKTHAGSLIGKKGKTISKLGPDKKPGKVLIGKTEWLAVSDEPVAAGKYVEVVDMKGIHLVVIDSDKLVDGEDEE